MGWTVPRDWVADEVVTAAVMNSAVRDNLRYLKGLDGDITFEDDIITSNNVDGVDVSAHESRHVSGGDDDIDSALAIAAMANLTENKVWKGNVSNRPTEIDFPTRTLSAANDTVTEGYYAGTTLSAVDTDLAVGNIKKDTIIFGFTGTHNGIDDVASQPNVAAFQAYPGIGTAAAPDNLNDNDTTLSATIFSNGEYVEVVYGDLVVIKRWRQFGNNSNQAGDEFKITYWNVTTDAWVDWVTGISARVTADWSGLSTEAEVVTTKVRVVATAAAGAGTFDLEEMEIIY